MSYPYYTSKRGLDEDASSVHHHQDPSSSSSSSSFQSTYPFPQHSFSTNEYTTAPPPDAATFSSTSTSVGIPFSSPSRFSSSDGLMFDIPSSNQPHHFPPSILPSSLPSSLPSYMPDRSSTSIRRESVILTGTSHHGGMLYPHAGVKQTKRQAPVGQWKTPPQYLYAATTSLDGTLNMVGQVPELGQFPFSSSMVSSTSLKNNQIIHHPPVASNANPSMARNTTHATDSRPATANSAVSAEMASYSSNNSSTSSSTEAMLNFQEVDHPYESNNKDRSQHDERTTTTTTNNSSSPVHNGSMKNDDDQNIKMTSLELDAAREFASATGGLVYNPSILAKLSGTDESELRVEHTKMLIHRPDMLSVYAKLQEEDERRRERLARNRTAARLRRLKKKSLVETFEGEVSRYELMLNELENFHFGQNQGLAGLLGEISQFANLNSSQKRAFVASLLDRLSESVQELQKAHAENVFLCQVAAEDLSIEPSVCAELKQVLNLSPEQITQLKQVHQGTIDAQWKKLIIFGKCLAALCSREWLYFPGIERISDFFTETCSTKQIERLVSWSKVNAEVIQSLELIDSSEHSDPHPLHSSEDDCIFVFRTFNTP